MRLFDNRPTASVHRAVDELRREQIHKHAVAPPAVGCGLTLAHDPDASEPQLLVGADGAQVGRSRVDGEPVDTTLANHMANEDGECIRSKAAILPRVTKHDSNSDRCT